MRWGRRFLENKVSDPWGENDLITNTNECFVLNVLQPDQWPRRERVQLQEVWKGASQAAQAESKLVHPGRPAARLLQVSDTLFVVSYISQNSLQQEAETESLKVWKF